jgi:hypothetical protein
MEATPQLAALGGYIRVYLRATSMQNGIEEGCCQDSAVRLEGPLNHAKVGNPICVPRECFKCGKVLSMPLSFLELK